MKTIAIISEYNPFHNGHEYLINKAKEQFGNDTAVIAIMSGNYMQRGELAIADKTVRARAAVDCGVNLVLEIPFPFSVSSAEFYAKSGVHIANSIGIVDHLVFGSECGDIDLLCTVAQNMLSDKYSCALNTALKSPSEKGIGYPTLCAKIYNEIFGDFKSTLTESNNTLALEYIKALIKSNSTITPVTFRRIGAGYHDKIDSSHKYQSATALREIISDCIDSARKYMPDMSINTY